MIIIKRKEKDTIDRMLKEYKRKSIRYGVIKEVKERKSKRRNRRRADREGDKVTAQYSDAHSFKVSEQGRAGEKQPC